MGYFDRFYAPPNIYKLVQQYTDKCAGLSGYIARSAAQRQPQDGTPRNIYALNKFYEIDIILAKQVLC